jgi:hypothetical protein
LTFKWSSETIEAVRLNIKWKNRRTKFRVSPQSKRCLIVSKVVVFMKQGRRFGSLEEQRLDVWRRWKVGQTLHEIGRVFGKKHSSIRYGGGRGGRSSALSSMVARNWRRGVVGAARSEVWRRSSSFLRQEDLWKAAR